MTKTLTLLIAFFAFLSVGNAQEKIAQPAAGVHYGKNINKKNVLSTKELEQKLLTTDTFKGKVEGQVSSVCKMSGCYLILKDRHSRRYVYQKENR